MHRKEALLSASIGLLLTAIAGVVFWSTNLDLTLQRLAYRPVEPHWPYSARQPWLFFHDYGTWPGLLLALGALAVLALSFVRDSERRWRYPALFVFLFMALGPGLVTNVFGKMLYGRPRPDEIVEFGGSLRFHRAFEFGHPGEGFSFLCGHSSMGYLFFAFFFLCRGTRRWIGLLGGALFGLLIGISRVVQGAHFPSDVVLDGTLMFTVAAAISPIAALQPKRVAFARWKVALVSAIAALLTIVAFLFSTPVDKEYQFLWIRPDETRTAATRQDIFIWHEPREILFAVQKGDVEIDIKPQHDPLSIGTTVKGFGFPGAGNENTIRELQDGRILSFTDRLTGAYWEVHGSFGIALADDTHAGTSVRTDDGNVILHARRCKRPLRIGGTFLVADPSRLLKRTGNFWVAEGEGEPMTLSIAGHRLVVE